MTGGPCKPRGDGRAIGGCSRGLPIHHGADPPPGGQGYSL